MASHSKASPASQNLCDSLLTRLRAEGVNRREARTWCSFGIETRFAYVQHRRSGLQIYLYGVKVEDGQRLRDLADGSVRVAQRSAMDSDWARITPYYIEIDSEGEMEAAIPLLTFAAKIYPPKGSQTDNGACYLFPSEDSAREMMEGARISVQVSRVERDPAARKQCIRLFGAACSVCGFDFARVYGEIGLGFIHVHHLNPLAAAKLRRRVNPRTDLRPVCPNCHEMLHRQNPPLAIADLKARLETSTLP